jgi:pimeloyl-ACP methyl ester carboxylesterase
MLTTTDQYVQTNGIRLHYLDSENNRPTLLLMHGLTANAHAFDGLMEAGLGDSFRVISVDLRGRGQSDKPDNDYSFASQARDIIGLMDALHIDQCYVGGHSYGAFMTFYLAKHYPGRVRKMVLMDAAAQMHPDTRELLIPTLSRLGQVFPSFEAYIEKMKAAPYIGDEWDEAMLSYYQADTQTIDGGQVTTNSKPEHILQAINALGEVPWLEYMREIPHEAILFNATAPYGGPTAPSLLPKELALETVALMPSCQYIEVAGNHQTMLYGQGAKDMVAAIRRFLT